jgi:hypothetical protein
MVLGGFWRVRQCSVVGELLWGTVYIVLGVSQRVRQFSLVGGCFGALCRWFWVVFGELGNFPL